MREKVLITYASKYGATADIAGKIGQVLSQEGIENDVLSVKNVKDVTPYQAVILGSAVYMGRWLKRATKFLSKNEKVLAEKPLWIFSSGPAGEGDPVELLDGWRMPGKVQEIADRIGPRDIVVFHGSVDMEKVNVIERSMITNIKSPTGDFRDWEMITAWAKTISDELRANMEIT